MTLEADARRAAGILLHPTSLPGPFGIGDLGPSAYAWVDALVRAIEGFFRTHENRYVSSTKFGRVERVACGLLDGNVTGHRSNRQHANLGRAKRHDQGHGVIGGGIGIDQEKRFHAA